MGFIPVSAQSRQEHFSFLPVKWAVKSPPRRSFYGYSRFSYLLPKKKRKETYYTSGSLSHHRLFGWLVMKEGYLQMKISEFNDKLTQLEQLLSLEDSKIRLLQEKVGEYKDVIKRLQDVKEFKNQAITEIRKENETVIKNQIQQISQRLSEVLKELTTSKAEKMNETIALLQKREEEITTQAKQIQQHTKQFIYLLEHNDILMMKLANRKVLNEHDVVEMQRRATKKAEQTE